MPTGYTEGILDGDIKTFEQFAKNCIRNFGATIHMRDEDQSAEWKERTPSDYHTKEIEEANKLLAESKELSDEEVYNKRRLELLAEREYRNKSIEKAKQNSVKLFEFLEKAKAYNPPTDKHQGYKDFMVNQIKQTIDFDCNPKYDNEALKKIEDELLNMTAKTIRESMELEALKDLQYHNEEHKKDLQRCKEFNQWVMQVFASLK